MLVNVNTDHPTYITNIQFVNQVNKVVGFYVVLNSKWYI
jgi:hypothetical protein